PGQNAESHPQAHRGVGGFRVTASSSIRNFHEAPPAATGPRSFPGDSCAAGRAGPVTSSSNPTRVREAMSTPRSLPAQPVVSIVGATGAVGIDLIRCLEQRRYPLGNLRLMASARSAGRTLEFKGRPLPVEELTEKSFEGVDIALFSAGSSISKRFAPAAVAAGAVVIDNSSAFRLDAGVPLVVPEINPEAAFAHQGIIANPNCSTIISITPLWPVHRVNRIRRLVVATYQAASGAGAAAMEELRESTRAWLDGRAFEPKVLPHPYAFNAFSHNSNVDPETGYNEEEVKIMRETGK